MKTVDQYIRDLLKADPRLIEKNFDPNALSDIVGIFTFCTSDSTLDRAGAQNGAPPAHQLFSTEMGLQAQHQLVIDYLNESDRPANLCDWITRRLSTHKEALEEAAKNKPSKPLCLTSPSENLLSNTAPQISSHDEREALPEQEAERQECKTRAQRSLASKDLRTPRIVMQRQLKAAAIKEIAGLLSSDVIERHCFNTSLCVKSYIESQIDTPAKKDQFESQEVQRFFEADLKHYLAQDGEKSVTGLSRFMQMRTALPAESRLADNRPLQFLKSRPFDNSLGA